MQDPLKPDPLDGRVDVEALLASLPHDTVDSWDGGRSTTLRGLSVRSRVLLVLVTLEIIAIIGLSIERLATITLPLNTDSRRADFTYALVLILNSIFCCYYAFHGCLRERRMELIIFVLASILVSVYVIYQFASTHVGVYSDWKAVQLARFIIVCVLVPPSSILAGVVAHDFGWLEFKTVGADEALKSMFRTYGLFTGLLKLDLQLAMTLVIMSGFNGLTVGVELAINIVGLVVTLIWCFAAWYWVRYEIAHIHIPLAIFSLFEPAYIIWKVINIMNADQTAYVEAPVVFVACGAMIVRVLLIIFGAKAFFNFGRGLKNRVLVKKNDFGEESPLIRPSTT